MILTATAFVIRVLLASGNRSMFISVSIIFGLLVSWLVGYALKRRILNLLVGLVFGSYLGLIYAEFSLEHVAHYDDIKCGLLLSALFTVFGIGLSVVLESAFHRFARRKPAAAAPAAFASGVTSADSL